MRSTAVESPMHLLQPGYRFTENERWILILLLAGLVLLIVAARIPALVRLLPDCPIQRTFGLHCPSCGIGRAALALARLDLRGAWGQNPLLLITLPYVLYRLATVLTGVATGRRLAAGWPRWFTRGYQYLFILAWGVLAVVRLVSWIWPELNPHGHGLPLS
ncbi:MAG: DUF2752 domain-containing protein [Candidatus Eisenbacteria bacterium]|nr:DUF2752 domain-containing protein [Candidatus Eisenbacteria bacterium]